MRAPARTRVAGLALLLCASAASANTAYRADAGSGDHAEQIYWMDWTGYNSTADGSTPFTFDLADGSKLTLNLIRTGSGSRSFQGVCSPTWDSSETASSAMGVIGYTWHDYPGTCPVGSPSTDGVPNVVLYPVGGNISSNVTFTLSNIALHNPRGDAVNEFEIIVADGESMDTGDGASASIQYATTGGSWQQLERVPVGVCAASGACASGTRRGPAVLPGVGTGAVTQSAVATPVAAWLVTTAKPATGTFDVTTTITSNAKQGIMLGMRWGAVRLTKNIVSRGDPSDQFVYRITNNAATPVSIGRGPCTAALPGGIGDCTTSGAATGMQDTISASIMPGNIVTLSEAMAPGSASTLANYVKTIQCSNANAASTTPLPGNGAAIPYDPANPPTLDVRNADDLIDCVITNAVNADVAVAKTGPATIAPGATISYELTISNNGPGNASGTLFNDAVPAAISGVAASCGTTTGGAVCNNADITVAGNTVSGSIAKLPVGASAKILITGTAPSSGQILRNSAHVDPPTGTTDPNTGNNDSSTVPTEVVVADMEATIDLPPSANAGDPVQGTFACTNNGPSAAANATCEVSGLPSDATVQCVPTPPVASLPAGSSIQCTVDFTAPGSGPISGTATAGSDTPDPLPGNNVASDDLVIVPKADLSITKIASPAGTYVPGQALNYTITVSNSGPSDATGVSVTDIVPASVTVSGWTCAASGAGADCDTAQPGTGASGAGNAIALTSVALPKGTSLTISVSGTASTSATGPIVNSATVTPPPGLACSVAPCAHTATATNANGGQVELTIQKSATPGAFAVGQNGTYSLLVSNTGSTSSSGAITINDPLPAGITTTALPSGAGWDCSASTASTITCTTNAVLTPGANAPIITAPVAIAAGTVSPAHNTADVTGGGDSTCPGAAHCSSTIDTPVNAPLIDISKTLQGSLIVGVPTTYTITATNNGQADTLAGTITDTIPTGLLIGTLPVECSASGQLVTCGLPAGIVPGGSVSFIIPITPQASANGQNVSNTATGNGGGDPSCPNADHCSDTATGTVTAPQLQLVKSATPTAFVVGQPAIYTLTLTNVGTAATTAVTTITDVLPTGLTIGTMPTDCTVSGQQVTCTIAAGLATGVPVSFDIPVVPTAALDGQSVTNNAGATGGGDPGCVDGTPTADLPARCHDAVTTVIGAPQLTIVKTASDASFVVGEPASYTLTVTNTGAAATTSVATITDVVPTGLTIGSLPADCSATGQQVECTVPSGLPSGGTLAFLIPVTPTVLAVPSVSNTATVIGGGDPSCPAATHCSSTVVTPVGAAALSIVKTASDTAFVVGTPASYTLTVTNTGSAATTAIATISDNVPAALTLGTLPADCSAAGQQVTCTIAAGFAAGASTSFTIPVTPTAAASGTALTNTATVIGGGDPSCPAATHCSSTVVTPVGAAALSIVKTASDTAFVVGTPASYTLTVTNTGSAATTAIATISDNVPAALTLGTLPADCSAAGQQVTCTIAAGFAAGASTSFTIPVTPTAAASGTALTNTATVIGGGDPSCPAATHCSSTVITPVDAPSLAIVKVGPATAIAGQTISYTITVTNNGSAAATHAVLDDVPPNGLGFVSAGAPCSAGFPCDLGDLAPGQSVVVSNVVFTVAQNYSGQLVNVAGVSSNETTRTSSSATTVVTPAVPPTDAAPVPLDARWALLALVGLLIGLGAHRARARH